MDRPLVDKTRYLERTRSTNFAKVSLTRGLPCARSGISVSPPRASLLSSATGVSHYRATLLMCTRALSPVRVCQRRGTPSTKRAPRRRDATTPHRCDVASQSADSRLEPFGSDYRASISRLPVHFFNYATEPFVHKNDTANRSSQVTPIDIDRFQLDSIAWQTKF